MVEIKATLLNEPVFVAQTLNYLKATRLPVAMLLNFGKPKLLYRRLVLGDILEEKNFKFQ